MRASCGCRLCCYCFVFFFFNDTATTEIYTLSLHDALPILIAGEYVGAGSFSVHGFLRTRDRSEEHTSELQSLAYLVCRLLFEKKKYKTQVKQVLRKIVTCGRDFSKYRAM